MKLTDSKIGICFREKDVHLGTCFLLYDFCAMRFKDFF